MALVDDVRIRDQLVAGAEDSSRAGGAGETAAVRLFVRRKVLPNDACEQAGGGGVGLQHERVGRRFGHGVRVEVLIRHMRRGLHDEYQRGCSAAERRTGVDSSTPLKSKSCGLLGASHSIE